MLAMALKNPFWLWFGDLFFGVLVAWLARLAIWKLFMEHNPAMEDAPQP